MTSTFLHILLKGPGHTGEGANDLCVLVVSDAGTLIILGKTLFAFLWDSHRGDHKAEGAARMTYPAQVQHGS